MNILYVDHYAGSPEHGMEFRPYYLAHHWQKMGHKVTIVASSFSHLRNTNFENLGMQDVDGVDYFILPSNKYKGNGVMRVLSILLFVLQMILLAPYFALRFRPDVVIASSTYPLDTYPCWMIARMCGANLVHEIHDLWPLSPIEIGGLNSWHPFILLMRSAEKFAYGRSDKIISILPKTFEHVAQDGVLQSNFKHIPNGIFYQDYRGFEQIVLPSDIEMQVRNSTSNCQLSIVYAGNLSASNAVEDILSAALVLKDEPINFAIIGNGPLKNQLVKFARENDLERIHFLDRMPKIFALKAVTFYDAAIFTMLPHSLYRFGISLNKLYDYMLTSRPIIAAFEAGNDPIRSANCGIRTKPKSPEELATAIKMFTSYSKDQLRELGENGKKYVHAHHDYEKLAKDFLDFVAPQNAL